MLYRFQSAAAGDVLMTAPVAEKVLAAAGRQPSAQGIFQVADLPAAIASLQQAMQQSRDNSARQAAARQQAPDSPDDSDAPPAPIALYVRAQPFLELLEHSLRAGKPVVWGV